MALLLLEYFMEIFIEEESFMIAGIQSAVSGLQAYTTKIANNANNIANVNTEGFKRDRVVLSTQAPQGVKADVEQVNTPGPMVAEQSDQGLVMVEQSNVDLGEEFVDVMISTHGFKANLKTVQAADALMQAVLDIKA
jgi:flagellar basal-body rod protein FlgC